MKRNENKKQFNYFEEITGIKTTEFVEESLSIMVERYNLDKEQFKILDDVYKNYYSTQINEIENVYEL